MNNTLEIIAAAIGIAYLVLQYKANVWMWVCSLVMSAMYVVINFNHGLYANFVLQIIFSVMAVVGLLAWLGIVRQHTPPPITSMPRRMIVPLVAATLLLTVAIVAILRLLGEGSMPYFDGLTMAINLTGTYMLIRKYYQEWICWMIVDPLMCVMYAMMGMWPSAVLYAIYSIVVVFGYINWKKQSVSHDIDSNTR